MATHARLGERGERMVAAKIQKQQGQDMSQMLSMGLRTQNHFQVLSGASRVSHKTPFSLKQTRDFPWDIFIYDLKLQIVLRKHVTHYGSGTMERRCSQMYLHVVFSPDTQVPTTQDKGYPRAAAAAKKAVQLPPASTFSIQKKKTRLRNSHCSMGPTRTPF